MTYDEYLRLVLIAKLKQSNYDVEAASKLLNMKKCEVIKFMKLFSLPEKRRKGTIACRLEI